MRISPETIQALASAADSAAVADIYLSDDTENIIIDFEFHERYQNFVKALDAWNSNGKWLVPSDRALDVVAEVHKRNLDLLVHPDVESFELEPIPGFDGTIVSLKGVELETLMNVAKAKMAVRTQRKSSLTFADRLRSEGISDLFDLALHFPLKYIDRSQPVRISDMQVGEQYTIIGKIKSITTSRRAGKNGRGGGTDVSVVVEDGYGKNLKTTFFSQVWIARMFAAGDPVLLTGEYNEWRAGNGAAYPQMKNPRMDSLDTASDMPVIPIYPQSEKNGLSTQAIMRATFELFHRLGEITDVLPYTSGKSLSYDRAIRSMHFPRNMSETLQGRDVLVHAELFMLQLHILSMKRDYGTVAGNVQTVSATGHMAAYLESLPYTLTGAQSRALREIAVDFSKDTPMHRLLQGDVSSGKTTIAHAVMLNAVDNGNQGAILAPTEILAEQLYLGLHEAMSDTGVRVEFLGTKTRAKARVEILAGLASGDVDVLIGTHAILQDDVIFKRLTTVVVDEQHRFGTAQRDILKNRGVDGKVPDMLIMTATPIPRSGAMVLYGDLDLTVLDELPPGRVPITTRWLNVSPQQAIVDAGFPVWDHIRAEVAKGHQAYVVTSMIEDSETETRAEAASAESTYETLSTGVLHGLRLGIMHGRMNRKDRERIMSDFARGEIDVLVATTVIEVGVNVPNATVMVVLDSGNFGIAQLHQIRGRVGRASWASSCYLVGDVKTPIGMARMEALVASSDGFYLSEKDLELRGEGEVFGSTQSGVSDLKLASIVRDMDILSKMREEANLVLDTLPWAQVVVLRKYVKEYYRGKEISS